MRGAVILGAVALAWLVLRSREAEPSWVTLYPFDWAVPPADVAKYPTMQAAIPLTSEFDVPVMWILWSGVPVARYRDFAAALHARFTVLEGVGLSELAGRNRQALRAALIAQARSAVGV